MMYNYFKLPNFIFDYNLSSSEIAVVTALYSIKSNSIRTQNHTVKVKQETICKITGIKSKITVSKAIKHLMAIGIIKWAKRSKKANNDLGTYQYALQPVGRGYSKVKRSILGLLSTAELRVYLFINKCIDSKIKHCWNSYNDISAQIGMARSRVVELIKALVKKGYLFVKKVKSKEGDYSDNHYYLADSDTEKNDTKRKKSVSSRQTPPISITTYINTFMYEYLTVHYTTTYFTNCQDLYEIYYFGRGSPIFYISTYITHSFPTERKKYRCTYKRRCNLEAFFKILFV